MRTILATTLLIVTAVIPPHALARQLGAGDMIDIRPSPVSRERQWGEQPPSPTWTEATVVRLANDTLWYRVGRSVAPMSVWEGDVRRPSGHDHRWLTAIVSGVAVATVASLVGYATYEPNYNYRQIVRGDCWSSMGCTHSRPIRDADPTMTRAEVTGAAALGGAVAGSVLGYLVGKRLGRWERVDLTPALTDAGGVSLGVRVGQ